MKIHEYQARQLFEDSGIPIPKGSLCKTPEEARDAASKIGKPVVVKAQILVAGRGKAGGVKPAQSPDEVRRAWDSLPSGTTLVILTPAAAAALNGLLDAADPLTAVMPA